MRTRLEDPQALSVHPSVARLEDKLARRGINPHAPGVITDTPEPLPALEAAMTRIPGQYQAAIADHTRVAAWVRTVADAAQAPSTGARRQVAHGPSLLLVGPTGTGKTYQTYGAIRSLLAMGVGARWQALNTADFYGQMRPQQGVDPEWMLRHLVRTPLLSLDDLGAPRTTEWTEELTYRLIDYRYSHQLPTLMTSNLTIAALRSKLGDRVASRIAGMAELIPIDGPDRRRGAA
ncbi:ATP-binding protein [Streptomyces nigrescens]